LKDTFSKHQHFLGIKITVNLEYALGQSGIFLGVKSLVLTDRCFLDWIFVVVNLLDIFC